MKHRMVETENVSGFASLIMPCSSFAAGEEFKKSALEKEE